MRKFAMAAVLVVMAAFMVVACGTDTAPVPDVIGYRLDDAHNKLKDAGFEKFEDNDMIQDREPMMDANWVVLKQTPAADSNTAIDATIHLEIAKPEDAGVQEKLPAGSPVAMELQQRDAEQKAAQSKAVAADRAEAKTFVDKIDPQARLMKNAITDLGTIAQSIRTNGVVTVTDSVSLTDIGKALGVYWEVLEDAPESINPAADRTQEAIKAFQQAADTLQTAEGPAAPGALARFAQIYDPAKTKYDSGLAEMYDGTGIEAPTISATRAASPAAAGVQFLPSMVRAKGVTKEAKGGQTNVRFVAESQDATKVEALTHECVRYFVRETRAAYCYGYGTQADYDKKEPNWTPEFDETVFGGSRPCWVVQAGQSLDGDRPETVAGPNPASYQIAQCPGDVKF